MGTGGVTEGRNVRFRSGGNLSWNYKWLVGSAGTSEGPHSPAIGQIQWVDGAATVVRPGEARVAAKPGGLVYQGDVIETAADGAVEIVFRDGTTFKLADSARMALDEFGCDPEGRPSSALFTLARGAFAFLSGALARAGKLRIETPVASIRGRAETGGIGFLTLAALTFSVVQESLAANPDDAAPDDNSITVKDLLHGTFTLAIKDDSGRPTGQVVTVDDPQQSIVIRKTGTSVSVDHVTNNTSRMTDLQEQYQGTLQTLSRGYSFMQQTNPGDFASTAGGSAGAASSVGFIPAPTTTNQTTSATTTTATITQNNSSSNNNTIQNNTTISTTSGNKTIAFISGTDGSVTVHERSGHFAPNTIGNSHPVDPDTPVSGAIVVVYSDGSVSSTTWTYNFINANYQYLAEGEEVQQTVTVSAAGSSFQIPVTIVGTNENPIISPAHPTTTVSTQGSVAGVSLSADGTYVAYAASDGHLYFHNRVAASLDPALHTPVIDPSATPIKIDPSAGHTVFFDPSQPSQNNPVVFTGHPHEMYSGASISPV